MSNPRSPGVSAGASNFSVFISDVSNVTSNSSVLQYAHDMRILRKIRSVSDCRVLQEDAYSFYNWCVTNSLILNKAITKCPTREKRTAYVFTTVFTPRF